MNIDWLIDELKEIRRIHGSIDVIAPQYNYHYEDVEDVHLSDIHVIQRGVFQKKFVKLEFDGGIL